MQKNFDSLPLIKTIREESFDKIVEFLENNYKEYEVKEGTTGSDKPEIVDMNTMATPLFYVTARKSREESVAIAKLLVEKYAICKATTKDLMKQDCMFYAAREGDLSFCQYLMEKGCNPNDDDRFGQTCLFYAAREGRTDCVKLLIDNGADPNIIDINKQTCLFYACREGRYDTVRCLLEHGANPQIKDTQRKTALSFAKINGHNNIVLLLKSYGGLNKSQSEIFNQNSALNITKKGSLPNTMVLQYPNETPPTVPSSAVKDENINKGVRKKYKLQYRPLEDDPLLWLDAPLVKINEFERKFPQLAVWSRNGIVPTVNSNPMNNSFHKQWYTLANSLVQSLSKYDGGHIFEKLVDPKKQNCPDYYDVIKNPISFSCIKSKLKKGVYQSPQEFIKDVQLVFDNCNLYNNSNSLVAITGKNIEAYFHNQLIVTGFNHFIMKEKKIHEELQKAKEENLKWEEEQKLKEKGREEKNIIEAEEDIKKENIVKNGNAEVNVAAVEGDNK